MNEYLYFKTNSKTTGHLPANRELVTDIPYEDYKIWRYPAATTIHMSLMMNSYSSYLEALQSTAYSGPDKP